MKAFIIPAIAALSLSACSSNYDRHHDKNHSKSKSSKERNSCKSNSCNTSNSCKNACNSMSKDQDNNARPDIFDDKRWPSQRNN